ncbi:hypothetical protein ABBQ32_000699 [Trebouxia sp. C0010 RCD-2024]
MSRLLLQTAIVVATPRPTTASAGAGKSTLIYTFTFIGASLVAGLLFLGIMFRYMIKHRMWRAPVTTPLQPARKPGGDLVSDLPHIKEIVVISNPDGCASIAIVRQEEVSDGQPPFLTYETQISQKAFADYSKGQSCAGLHSAPSMTHAASASDLAGLNTKKTLTTSQRLITPERVIAEHENCT